MIFFVNNTIQFENGE